MTHVIGKAFLFLRLVLYAFKLAGSGIRRAISHKVHSKPGPDQPRTRNIVVVGAAFAGYHAARLIAPGLPRGSPFKVIVIEPNSHFNFTWVLPRFCVINDHEHKAFIPYVGYLAGAPEGSVRWIRDRAVSIGRNSIRLRDSPEEIPYEFLVIATGSDVAEGLPSRVGAESKEQGTELLRGVQRKIKAATKIVVAGGGAAGVELATDAKSAYPDKTVVLVHSRKAVMNRFGPYLQTAALEGLQRLGCEVILEERVASHDSDKGTVTLSSGRVVESDCYINCTGQKPASGIIAELAPGAISADGHIKVKPTLQIADDSLPNVYVCGDVADTHARNPNSRSAMTQAEIVGDNILLAIRGKAPRYHYAVRFGEGLIKLTLGLDRSVIHFFDGKDELSYHSKDTDLALMCDGAWKHMGATPFEDSGEIEWMKNSEAPVEDVKSHGSGAPLAMMTEGAVAV